MSPPTRVPDLLVAVVIAAWQASQHHIAGAVSST